MLNLISKWYNLEIKVIWLYTVITEITTMYRCWYWKPECNMMKGCRNLNFTFLSSSYHTQLTKSLLTNQHKNQNNFVYIPWNSVTKCVYLKCNVCRPFKPLTCSMYIQLIGTSLLHKDVRSSIIHKILPL